ncbi:RNase A-like domain-containing protein [Bacillus stercoris]|uniref:RNase A-like domain-containing protein n=1 Tax=Bacillus TaxID=1386 RepID=UPI002DBF3DA1|nr:RNase A-like domain-containing protein [Bacillus subtilis]
MDRHIGKTDEKLLQRLQKNKKIRASSSFIDRPTAERVANEKERPGKANKKYARLQKA